MAKKENNQRRFPGQSGKCRPDKAAKRKVEAADRQDKYNKLSPAQKIEKLDVKFGVGLGAKRERARLQQKLGKTPNNTLEHLSTQQISSEIMQEIEAINEEFGSKKRVKAKDRRAKANKE